MVGREQLRRSGGGGGRVAGENGGAGSTVVMTSRPRHSFNFVDDNCHLMKYDNYMCNAKLIQRVTEQLKCVPFLCW